MWQSEERRDLVVCKYQSTESFQFWTQERSEKLEWVPSTQLSLEAYQIQGSENPKNKSHS